MKEWINVFTKSLVNNTLFDFVDDEVVLAEI